MGSHFGVIGGVNKFGESLPRAAWLEEVLNCLTRCVKGDMFSLTSGRGNGFCFDVPPPETCYDVLLFLFPHVADSLSAQE